MKTLIINVLILFSFILQAQIIPQTSTVEWNKAGYKLAAKSPAINVNIMDFGAHADGVTDDFSAFSLAIASLNGHYGVINIPAGTYLLQTGITLPDSVILRGAGSTSTYIKINSTGVCFGIYGTSTNSFTSVLSGYQKDSQKITVGNSSIFQIGNTVEMRQNNGTWDLVPASWAEKAVGQITKITAIIGDTLYLEDKLRLSFDPMLNLEIQKINTRKQVNIEYLNIERVNNSLSSTAHTIEFLFAENCRVKGIESNKSHGSHCKITLSTHIEITGSYFHDALTYDGVGTKGYGISLDTHSGMCLISNNIFKHLRHAMMTKVGANGNVFAYNYSHSVFRNGIGELPDDLSGDISLHGHYSFANLFEGNVVQNIIIDEYWGPSGPYNTFVRNRTEHYGIYMDATNTHQSNYVGNEIIGTFPSGFFNITGTSNLLWGNNQNGIIVPSGTNTFNDASYYLSSLPLFWDISNNWPSIGINNLLNTGTIPAKTRYFSGIYTEMPINGPFTDFINIKSVNFDIYPNPTIEFININFYAKTNSSITLNINDLEGKILSTIKYENINVGLNKIKLNVGLLPKGVYFLKIIQNSNIGVKKIMKL